MVITITDVLNVIVSGQMDEHLDDIRQAFIHRQRVQNQQRDFVNAASIKKGDKVRLGKISPQYLQGVVVTVSGKKGDKLLVDFGKDDWQAGKYMGLKGIGVHAGSAEKVK